MASTAVQVKGEDQATKPAEAFALAEKEAREHAERAWNARQQMSQEDRMQIESLAAALRPHCLCGVCQNVMLEPWLVKDCGHKFCFRCLHSLVYESRVKGCPTCKVGNQGWTEDSFGAFKIVVTADKNRKVGRDGGRFVYDDSTDGIIRALWPERMQDYIQCDVDREQRRVEDVTARKHFEETIQTDRLANPSSTHPGLAATRSGRRHERGSAAARALSTRLMAPPLKLSVPILTQEVPRPRGSFKVQKHHVLVMPIHNCASAPMREWAAEQGLMQDVLPALIKPYLVLPVTNFSVTALKQVLAELLKLPAFWHDSSHNYPATDGIEASDMALYLDWTAATPETPEALLVTELPDDETVQQLPGTGKDPFSLWAIMQWASRQNVNILPTFDLVYCARAPKQQSA